jgi:DNA-binding NtrC family response regulator
MEMAVALCIDGMISLLHLPPDIRESCAGGQDQEAAGAVFLADKVRSLERELIAKALEESGGKKTEAADKLGVCRRTLWKKMRDLQMPGALLEDDE